MLLNPAQSPCAPTGHLQGPEGSDLGAARGQLSWGCGYGSSALRPAQSAPDTSGLQRGPRADRERGARRGQSRNLLLVEAAIYDAATEVVQPLALHDMVQDELPRSCCQEAKKGSIGLHPPPTRPSL